MSATARCLRPGCDKTWPRDPALEVACPTCMAPAGRRCRRPSEHVAFAKGVHAARDVAADEAGHYGPCPLSTCGLLNKAANVQLSLFGARS